MIEPQDNSEANSPAPPPSAYAAPPPEELAVSAALNKNAKEEQTSTKKKLIRNGIIVSVVAMLALAVTFCGKKDESPPVSLGNPPTLAVGNPENTPPQIAEDQKRLDEKKAEAALGDKQALARGTVLLPKPTREFDDPLEKMASDKIPTLAPGDEQAPPPVEESPVAVENQVPVSTGESTASTTEIEDNSILTDEGSSTVRRGPHGGGSSSPAEAAAESEYAKYSQAFKVRQTEQRGSTQPAPRTKRDSESNQAGGGQQSGQTAVQTASSTGLSKPSKVLARMGQVLYASMDYKADSDSSSFIQATIVSGPFRGAKVQGRFTVKTDNLELTFDRIAWKSGTYTIKAIGVNPEEPEIGMATDVNHHYISRFGGLFIASMLSGIGQNLANEGTTVSTSALDQTVVTKPNRSFGELVVIGAGKTAENASSLVMEAARRRPTVIIAASTPIGINFVSDWLDKDTANSSPVAPTGPGLVTTGAPSAQNAALNGYVPGGYATPDGVSTNAPFAPVTVNTSP